MMKRFTQTFSRFPFGGYLFTSAKGYGNMAENPANIVQFDFLKEKLLLNGITLIDVREPSELKDDGKIPNSINIPLGQVPEAFNMSDAAFKAKYGVSKPDFTSDFVLSCRSGKRATGAFEKLRALGYKNISVYSGSFLDWLEKGGPIEK